VFHAYDMGYRRAPFAETDSDLASLDDQFEDIFAKARETKPERAQGMLDIGAHQVAVYVMCGGGIMGQFAAEQPADFYIDSRCARLPYSRKEIEQAVAVLAVIAETQGLDPHRLQKMPRFHASGVF